MSDRKRKQPRNFGRGRTGKPAPRRTLFPIKSLLSGQAIVLPAAWTAADLQSNTSGAIAQTYSPSITQASEYSGYSTQYQRIKLISWSVEFTSVLSNATNVDVGSCYGGTNIDQNINNTAAPSSMTGVENLKAPFSFLNSTKRIIKVRGFVPPLNQLIFLPLTADSPTPVAPGAGCPGSILIYGPNHTPSTVYYTTVVVRARFLLMDRF